MIRMTSEPNPGIGPPAATGPPPAVVYVPVAVRPTVYERYSSKQSIGTGIVQIIIGVLCIIFNIVDLVAGSYPAAGTVGHGFWCGIMFIVTGGFGIGAGKNKTKCQIVAYMVLCIISASLTIGLLTVGIIGAAEAGYGISQNCNNYYVYPYYHSAPCNKKGYQTAIAMESLLAILALVEAIIAIYAAAMCCKSGVCCCGTPPPIPGGYMPTNGQMIYISQTPVGQPVYLPQQMMGYPSGHVAPPPAYAASYTQPAWSFPPPPQPQATGFPPPQTGNAPEYTAPPRDEKF